MTGDKSRVVAQAGNGCAIALGGEDGGLRAVVESLIGLELARRSVSHGRGLPVKMDGAYCRQTLG